MADVLSVEPEVLTEAQRRAEEMLKINGVRPMWKSGAPMCSHGCSHWNLGGTAIGGGNGALPTRRDQCKLDRLALVLDQETVCRPAAEALVQLAGGKLTEETKRADENEERWMTELAHANKWAREARAHDQRLREAEAKAPSSAVLDEVEARVLALHEKHEATLAELDRERRALAASREVGMEQERQLIEARRKIDGLNIALAEAKERAKSSAAEAHAAKRELWLKDTARDVAPARDWTLGSGPAPAGLVELAAREAQVLPGKKEGLILAPERGTSGFGAEENTASRSENGVEQEPVCNGTFESFEHGDGAPALVHDLPEPCPKHGQTLRTWPAPPGEVTMVPMGIPLHAAAPPPRSPVWMNPEVRAAQIRARWGL